MSRQKGDIMYSRKELLAVPKNNDLHELHGVICIYIIPNGRKHDSGYACMDFVAEFKDNKKSLVRFGGGTDAIDMIGEHFKVDCLYPSRIIRSWNRRTFSVEFIGLSSIDLREATEPRQTAD